MPLTRASFQDDRNTNPQADADAAVNAYDATRMRREAGIASVAAEHTTGSAGETAYADGAFTLGEPKTLGGVKGVGGVPDAGFPGDGFQYTFNDAQVTS